MFNKFKEIINSENYKKLVARKSLERKYILRNLLIIFCPFFILLCGARIFINSDEWGSIFFLILGSGSLYYSVISGIHKANIEIKKKPSDF
ncbi:MAG: hypothetical protein CMH27_07355 [Micavibrio sp.]|nr:hypothetical protein [Micavibrio sp.]|tara:strand:+ start:1445 stop:1717 length:273 start_codon:yes stop_codon:yes gene_type:complete